MAQSTCIKRGHHKFELAHHEPKKAKWKYFLVQCGSCGGVVGAVEFFNVGAILHRIADELGVDLS